MELERIVIAADESEAGRQAIRVGGKLAGMTSASISVLRVVFRRPAAFAGAGLPDHILRRWSIRNTSGSGTGWKSRCLSRISRLKSSWVLRQACQASRSPATPRIIEPTC